jgi:hypothetical protein
MYARISAQQLDGPKPTAAARALAATTRVGAYGRWTFVPPPEAPPSAAARQHLAARHSVRVARADRARPKAAPVGKREPMADRADARSGRKGGLREHPIGGRAALAFVDEQHCQSGLLFVVVPSGRVRRRGSRSRSRAGAVAASTAPRLVGASPRARSAEPDRRPVRMDPWYSSCGGPVLASRAAQRFLVNAA